MKKIAIISDTHGLLRAQVLSELDAADVIFHIGDITTPAIMKTVQEFGITHVVRGNNDKKWAENLPQSLRVTLEDVRFFLVHNRKDVPENLKNVDVIVYGHSHKYAAETVNGVLWLNPGSCGKRRFDLDITMCRMTVDAGQYRFEKLLLQNAPAAKRREG